MLWTYIHNVTVFSLNLHPDSFVSHYYHYYIILYTRARDATRIYYIVPCAVRARWNGILNYSSRAPCTYFGGWMYRRGGGGGRGRVGTGGDDGARAILLQERAWPPLNRFYCRFTQYRMKDPIMSDASCINHRRSCVCARVCVCTHVFIYVHVCVCVCECARVWGRSRARALGIRKFTRTFEKRSETV